MQKFKDPLGLGIISGVVGGMVGYAVDIAISSLGRSPLTWTQQSAGLTVSQPYRKGRAYTAIGVISVLGLSSLLGIPYSYMLSRTGTQSLAGKTALYAWASWIVVHGLGSRVAGTFNSPPITSLAVLGGNLASAITQAAVVTSLTDETFYQPHTR